MEKVLALGYVILLLLCPYRIKEIMLHIRETHQKKDIFLVILWSLAGLAVYIPLILFLLYLAANLLFGYGTK